MARFSAHALLCCLLLAASSCTEAFVTAPSTGVVAAPAKTFTRASAMVGRRRRVLNMSEGEEEVVAAAPDDEFFQPNANMRYGSSKDQDGKSNIWAVEPKVQVQDSMIDAGEGSGIALGVGIAALALVVATIAFLPSADSI